MDDETLKQQLLNTIQTERAKWDALIAQVSEERMTEPGVDGENGEWTVKDVVAHIAIYEDWMARLLNAGGPNIPHEVDTMSQDQRNAWILEHNSSMSVSEALTYARNSYEALIDAIEALAPSDLTSPERFEWAHGKPVYQLIPNETYRHYQDHVPGIRRWLGLEA